ncbi:zinc finger, CCHC-type, retrotransposon gag domain protein [Tanacetum coccineum]
MVNTRTDAELAAAVQAAVDAMLPQIREQVREEYRTGASGSNPPPVTIHTWLERFNKQKPRSFEKAVAPVDAENWISHMEKIFDVMDCNDAFKTRLAVYKFEGDALAWWKAYKQAKGGDAWVLTLTWAAFKELFFLQFFPRAEQERLKREYHSIRQRASENSTEYMQRFLRLAGFLGQAAGTAEEQAKNFRWGLHKSILDHVMCIQFTDVAQVADAARNLEILRDRDDYDRSEPYRVEDPLSSDTQQNNYRSHDQKNDRQGSDRQGGGGNYRNNNNNKYSRDNNRSNLNRYRLYLLYDMNLTSRHGNRNSGAGRDQRNRGSQQSRVPSEGYTHPVCTTCGRRHPGECRRAAGTCFKCGQAGHLQRDCKKNTGASSSGHADKKPDASGRVFALTQDQAANTSGDILSPEFYLSWFLPGKSNEDHFHFKSTTYFWKNFQGKPPIAMLCLTLELIPGAGVVGARFYSPECIAMGAPVSVCQEEGAEGITFGSTAMVRLSPNGQDLTSVTEVRSFLDSKVINADCRGFLNRLALPLTKLMRKGEKFVWNEERERALKSLSSVWVDEDVSRSQATLLVEWYEARCALEWAGNWDDYICLVEFAYNNSWHASIKCAPFEMLYGRKCRAPICWDQVGERILEGPEILRLRQERLEFQRVHMFSESISIQVESGVLVIKGKLSPRFIGPFEILDRVGEVSYRLALPPQLSHVHNVFHVSLLRGYKYHPLHVVSYPFDSP